MQLSLQQKDWQHWIPLSMFKPIASTSIREPAPAPEAGPIVKALLTAAAFGSVHPGTLFFVNSDRLKFELKPELATRRNPKSFP